MATLPEVAEWTAGIYQLEEEDPVLGGENGVDNVQAKQLANRTRWLKAALGDDADFAANVIEALAGKQPLDETLIAIAAVATAANKLIYATGPDAFDTTDITALTRTFLAAASAADARTAIGAAPSGSIHQIRPITASVVGNALTLTLNPTTLDFRSNPLTSGTVNTRNVAAPISLTISSGSTLGTVNGQASRIVLIAIDNAGTVELAAVNLAGGVNLDETTLISTTAEGGAGAADSASVVYSQTARANVPFRVVGYVDSAQAAAGTWATAPSTIQGCGGQALASLQAIGYGQSVQTVTRAPATNYYNTTGRPIFLWLYGSAASGNSTLTVGGIQVGFLAYNSSGGVMCALIPPGAPYSYTGITLSALELR